jgi:hypothetical protein
LKKNPEFFRKTGVFYEKTRVFRKKKCGFGEKLPGNGQNLEFFVERNVVIRKSQGVFCEVFISPTHFFMKTADSRKSFPESPKSFTSFHDVFLDKKSSRQIFSFN